MAIKVGTTDITDVPGCEAVYVGSDKVWPVFVPYLEIDPEIIWLTPWALNDVLSNTDWNVT